MTEFQRKVSEYIKANQLDESKLARLIGVSSSQVNRWRRDEPNPQRPGGMALMKLLELIPDLRATDFAAPPEPPASVEAPEPSPFSDSPMHPYYDQALAMQKADPDEPEPAGAVAAAEVA
jgi:transcriptional regulator with XRE-family HTH domain